MAKHPAPFRLDGKPLEEPIAVERYHYLRNTIKRKSGPASTNKCADCGKKAVAIVWRPRSKSIILVSPAAGGARFSDDVADYAYLCDKHRTEQVKANKQLVASKTPKVKESKAEADTKADDVGKDEAKATTRRRTRRTSSKPQPSEMPD